MALSLPFEAYYAAQARFAADCAMPWLQHERQLLPSSALSVPVYARRQRRRMLIALLLLLLALLLVLVRDRQFWFPSSSADSDASTPAATAGAPARASLRTRRAARNLQTGSAENTGAQAGEMTAVITNRAVLPPLQVEVVAGNQRRTLRPGRSAVNIDMQPAAPEQSQADPTPVDNPTVQVGERVLLSPDTAQVVERPVEPNYPPLARQMKVQGSVVLDALIDKQGNIQDLRVSSGPSILASAALEAVKQWRFKPYYQDGQPMETQCSITVNFTISTH